MSNQSGIPETLDELKARGYPVVEEFVNKDGWCVVKIGNMLTTANAFPGAEARCSEGWAVARDIAFREYRKWVDDYVAWINDMKKSDLGNIGQDSLMSCGMDIV